MFSICIVAEQNLFLITLIFLLWISFSYDVAPEILGLMVWIQEVDQFSDFAETFPGNFRTIWPSLETELEFWSNGKYPNVSIFSTVS